MIIILLFLCGIMIVVLMITSAKMIVEAKYEIREEEEQQRKEEQSWDPHLRSTDGVSGHHIAAKDGEIGNVEDFIIDDETWAIR